jgi:hypothetical protein
VLQDELRQLTSTLSAERTAAAKAAAQQKRCSEELLAKKEVSPKQLCKCLTLLVAHTPTVQHPISLTAMLAPSIHCHWAN